MSFLLPDLCLIFVTSNQEAFAALHDAQAQVNERLTQNGLLSELDEADKMEMLESLGMKEPALAVVARGSYELLGLQSYFTAGPKEIRAWTIRRGYTAPKAAGVIHGDFERGFIRAECYSVDELEQYTSEKSIREAGKLRSEGKDYVVQDGDVVHFLFNV